MKIIIIQNILGKLKNDEHFILFFGIIERQSPRIRAIAILAGLCIKFENCFKKEDVAYKQTLYSAETKQLQALDRQRGVFFVFGMQIT